ncbi:MAG: two-component regulator propeller domain-containing protein, partial [Bacteroidota bacterium]
MKRRPSLFFISAVIYFAFQPVYGQNKILYFHQLTSTEGLSQSTNEALYPDSGGNIWIGSLDGLNLFTGKSVQVFKNNPNDEPSLGGGTIQSDFFEDKNKNIWFATNEAINVYLPEQGNFKKISLGSNENKAIHHIFCINDEVLLGAAGDTLYEYSTDLKENNSIAVPTDFSIVKAKGVWTESKKILYVYGEKNGLEIIEFDGQRLISKKTAVFDKAKHPSDQALFFYEIYPEEETFWGLSN